MRSRLAPLIVLLSTLTPAAALAQAALDTWHERPAALRAVATGFGHVVTVGDAGSIRVSVDSGATWTSADSPVTTRLTGVAVGLGHWVAVGENGVMLTSIDA